MKPPHPKKKKKKKQKEEAEDEAGYIFHLCKCENESNESL